jgi:hypothetical protein
MGLDWDKALPSLAALKECCRVLKAGAFGFFMCAPRQDVLGEMIHLLNRAGFETDFSSIYWTYAQGFYKGSNTSKAIDRRAGAEREVVAIDWKKPPATNCYGNYGDNHEVKRTKPATPEAKALDGSYTPNSLKPAVEVVLVCMKTKSEKSYTDQALKNGKGVLWLEDCRIPYSSENEKWQGGKNPKAPGFRTLQHSFKDSNDGRALSQSKPIKP